MGLVSVDARMTAEDGMGRSLGGSSAATPCALLLLLLVKLRTLPAALASGEEGFNRGGHCWLVAGGGAAKSALLL